MEFGYMLSRLISLVLGQGYRLAQGRHVVGVYKEVKETGQDGNALDDPSDQLCYL